MAFLGPELGFGHQAAQRHFGRGCRLSPQLGLEEVFQAVERGDCQAALVAVENSAEGAVGSSLDRMLASPLRVCGEIYARVGQVLMSREEDLGAVRTLHAHPQALARSRQWLATHLPGVALAEAPDLATAARLAAADPGSAALGTELAARETGLGLLAREVPDAPQATTRSWVLGPDACPAIGDDKTSLAFATPTSRLPHRALGCFVGHGLNDPHRVPPHPRRPWEYTFFVDLLGHREDPAVAAAVAELTRELPLVRMLGSYPAGRRLPAADGAKPSWRGRGEQSMIRGLGVVQGRGRQEATIRQGHRLQMTGAGKGKVQRRPAHGLARAGSSLPRPAPGRVASAGQEPGPRASP